MHAQKKSRPVYFVLGLNMAAHTVVVAGFDNNRQRAAAKGSARKLNGECEYDISHVFRFYNGTGHDISNWLGRQGIDEPDRSILVRQVGQLMLEMQDEANE
jgi:hypothetical protein